MLSKAHDSLSNELSTALLYRRKGERLGVLPWLPQAVNGQVGIGTKACQTQGLCPSEHITCEVFPRYGRKCLENWLRLSWTGNEAIGLLIPWVPGQVSW